MDPYTTPKTEPDTRPSTQSAVSIIVGIGGIIFTILNAVAVVRTLMSGYSLTRGVARHLTDPAQLSAVIGETLIAVISRGLLAIHVAGINMLWRATQDSIAKSVCSAMRIVNDRGFMSVAFPIIGAGSGSYDTDAALDRMLDAFTILESDVRVVIVRFEKRLHSP